MVDPSRSGEPLPVSHTDDAAPGAGDDANTAPAQEGAGLLDAKRLAEIEALLDSNPFVQLDWGEAVAAAIRDLLADRRELRRKLLKHKPRLCRTCGCFHRKHGNTLCRKWDPEPPRDD